MVTEWIGLASYMYFQVEIQGHNVYKVVINRNSILCGKTKTFVIGIKIQLKSTINLFILEHFIIIWITTVIVSIS